MADDTNTAERDAFEEWARVRFYSEIADVSDDRRESSYNNFAHHMAWKAWQARASLAASAGGEPVAPAAGAVAGPVAAGMVPVAEVVECGTMGQQTLREIDGRWRWLSIGERLYAQADTGFIATPTPAAQADSRCYDYAKRLAESLWNKHYKEAAPQWRAFDDLMGALTQIDNMVCGLTLAQADSVLEDAARWNEVLMHVGAANHLGGQHFTLNTLRIRDQMFLLRGSVAQHFTACIDDSRAARKQGDTHDNH